MIERIAVLYVSVIEPGLKILLVVILIAFGLYVFNFLRGGESKGNLISGLVNIIVKSIIKTVQLAGKALLGSIKLLLNTSRVIFATVRDFLKSEI